MDLSSSRGVSHSCLHQDIIRNYYKCFPSLPMSNYFKLRSVIPIMEQHYGLCLVFTTPLWVNHRAEVVFWTLSIWHYLKGLGTPLEGNLSLSIFQLFLLFSAHAVSYLYLLPYATGFSRSRAVIFLLLHFFCSWYLRYWHTGDSDHTKLSHQHLLCRKRYCSATVWRNQQPSHF